MGRWGTANIIQFMKIYKSHPILWDNTLKDSYNTKLKEASFNNMFEELKALDMLYGMSKLELKQRIKCLKDVYRQELIKLDKKRMRDPDHVEPPKLGWFEAASFLSKVLNTRKYHTTTSKEHEAYMNDHANSNGEGCSAEESTDESDGLKIKKEIEFEDPLDFDEGLKYNVVRQSTSNNNNSYDEFGKYVASELRRLPERQAILLQKEIQNSITRTRLCVLGYDESDYTIGLSG